MTEKELATDTNFRTLEAASDELVAVIKEALLEKKAENIKLLNVTGLTTLTDYFFICHGLADNQVKAVADNVTEKVKKQLGENVWKKEGFDTKQWIVLDYVNVVVHVFNKETREYYGLEKMWNDAEITEIADSKP